jgi:hypothetical protein
MLDGTEAIPEDGVLLMDAYENVFRAITPNWRELEAEILNSTAVEKEPERTLAWRALDSAQHKANILFRKRLTEGTLPAFIYADSRKLRLPTMGWEETGLLKSGIVSNFVSPRDPLNPGPSTDIDGVRRAVFVDRASLERLIRIDIYSSPISKATKKKGDGSFAPLDEPLLEEMKQLLAARVVASAEEAASKVAPRAHGAGTPESKKERLARRFRSKNRER